jgi:hypothetical protein
MAKRSAAEQANQEDQVQGQEGENIESGETGGPGDKGGRDLGAEFDAFRKSVEERHAEFAQHLEASHRALESAREVIEAADKALAARRESGELTLNIDSTEFSEKMTALFEEAREAIQSIPARVEELEKAVRMIRAGHL